MVHGLVRPPVLRLMNAWDVPCRQATRLIFSDLTGAVWECDLLEISKARTDPPRVQDDVQELSTFRCRALLGHGYQVSAGNCISDLEWAADLHGECTLTGPRAATEGSTGDAATVARTITYVVTIRIMECWRIYVTRHGH